MSRIYSSSFLSLIFHASLLGALYTLPSSYSKKRFEVTGSRKAMSIEVTLVSMPSIASIEIASEQVSDVEPSENQVAENVEDKAANEKAKPRETELAARVNQQSSADVINNGPKFDVMPQLKSISLERVEQQDVDAAQSVKLKDVPVPPRLWSEASVSRPAVSIVLPPPQVLGLDDTSADLANNSPPSYPEHAYRNGLEGTVILQLTIDEQGNITKLEMITSSGHHTLDQAAIEAIRNWKGKPAYRDGRAVTTEEILPIRFKL